MESATCAAALLLSSGVHAFETDAPAGDASSLLPEVHVAAHYDESIGAGDSASSGTIEGNLLQDIAILRPGEILEAVPGLVVTQHSGEGKANQYFLRGYNLDHGTDFATSVDGVPVNMPTNGHGQGYSDINFLIPELVDRIDYRKGPYYAENGDFSAAGSADIRYRETLDGDLAKITIGEDGYRRVLGAASSSMAASVRWIAAIEALGDDGPWIEPDRMRKFNALLKLADGNADRGWSADAIAYDAHWNSTDQVPLAAIEDGTLCRFCAVDPSDGGRTAREMMSGEWHAIGDTGELHASAYAEHYRLQLWSDFTFFENDPLRGDQFEQRDDRNLVGGSVAERWRHSLFGFESSSDVGVQVRSDAIHVSLLDTDRRIPFDTVSDNLVGETEAAVYVQNATTWTPWLRSVAGLRFDEIDLDVTSQTYAANSGTVRDQRALPKLSLIFGPWASTEFFANAGNGFHSNDARGAVYRFDPATGAPIDRAPALSGSFGEEIGVRTEAIAGLQSSLSLWRLASDSELVYTADSGGTEINGASRRYGIEWSNHLAIGERWLLDADLAWTRARYVDGGSDGDDIPNAVSKVASVGVTAQKFGPWSGSLRFEYIGGYPVSQDGRLRAPSSLVANLHVQRDVTPRVSVAFDVLNLLDRAFYDIAYEQDYRLTPSAPVVDGLTVHPGEPRQVRVSLSVRF